MTWLWTRREQKNTAFKDELMRGCERRTDLHTNIKFGCLLAVFLGSEIRRGVLTIILKEECTQEEILFQYPVTS